MEHSVLTALLLAVLISTSSTAAAHAAVVVKPYPDHGSLVLRAGGYVYAEPGWAGASVLIYSFNASKTVEYAATHPGVKVKMMRASSAVGWLPIPAGGFFEVYAPSGGRLNYSFAFYPYANYSDPVEENGWGVATRASTLSVEAPLETSGSPFTLSVSWASGGPALFEVYDASASRVAFSSPAPAHVGNTTVGPLPPGTYFLVWEDEDVNSTAVFYHATYNYSAADPTLFPRSALGVSAYPPSPAYPSAGVAGVAAITSLQVNYTPSEYYYGPPSHEATLTLLTSVAAEVDGRVEFFAAAGYIEVDTANMTLRVGDIIMNETGATSILSSGVAGSGRVYTYSQPYAYPPQPPYQVYAYNTTAPSPTPTTTMAAATAPPLYAALAVYLSVNPGTGFALHFGYSTPQGHAYYDNATVLAPGLEGAAIGGFPGEAYPPSPVTGPRPTPAVAPILGSEFTLAPGAPQLNLGGYGDTEVWNISVYKTTLFNVSAQLALLTLTPTGTWSPVPVVYPYAAATPATAPPNTTEEVVSGLAVVVGSEVGAGQAGNSNPFQNASPQPYHQGEPPAQALTVLAGLMTPEADYNATPPAPAAATALVYAYPGSASGIHVPIGVVPVVILGVFAAFFAFAAAAYTVRRRRLRLQEEGGQVITLGAAYGGGGGVAQTSNQTPGSQAAQRPQTAESSVTDPVGKEYADAVAQIEKIRAAVEKTREAVIEKYSFIF